MVVLVGVSIRVDLVFVGVGIDVDLVAFAIGDLYIDVADAPATTAADFIVGGEVVGIVGVLLVL